MVTEFAYDSYYTINFEFPLTAIIFCSVLSISYVVSLPQKIKHQQLTTKGVISGLLFLAVAVYLITLNVQVLARGGIYLCSEKESDAVVMQGIVEKIEECDNSYNQKYGRGSTNNGSTSFGVKIFIEGNCYYSITSGNLQPGDDAIITYLPKSRFVLKISVDT